MPSTQQETASEDQVEDPHKYIKELKGEILRLRNLKRVAGHELANKISVMQHAAKGLQRLIQLLQPGQQINQETIDGMTEYMDPLMRTSSHAKSIGSLLNLEHLSSRALRSNAGSVDIEEIVRDNIKGSEYVLKKDRKIKVEFLYDRPNGKPIEIWANEGFMNSIVNTTTSNQIKHAPKYSIIRQGLRLVDGSLEYIAENMVTTERDGSDAYGMQTGVGFLLLSGAAKMLRGELKPYDKPVDESYYNHREEFGYTQADIFSEEVFGLKLTLPLSELIYRVSKKE